MKRVLLGESAMCLLGSILCCVAVSAAEPDDRGYLTVTSVGTVTAAPAIVQLTGTISGSAELASDAMTTFAAAKEEALATLKELEVEGLSVETDSLVIGGTVPTSTSTIIRLQQQQNPDPPKTTVSQAVQIRLAGIDKLDTEQLLGQLVKIVDAAQEAGVKFGPELTALTISSVMRQGPPTYTTYQPADVEALKERATEEAMKKARARAEKLAALAGGKVGQVRTITEGRLPTVSYTIPGAKTVAENSSPSHQQIEVRVSLTVQYELTW